MKKLFLSVLFLLFTVVTFGQTKQFRFEYDFSRFSYDSTSGYIEIYYSFYQPMFKFIIEENQKTIHGSLKVMISDTQSKIKIIEKEYQFKSIIDDSANNQEQKSLIGNLGYILQYGKYECFLIGKDLIEPSNSDTVSFAFQIDPLIGEQFSISDIELASSISESRNETSMFYKNSYEVVPNPSMIYGESLPVLYFYTEIYNLSENIKSELIRVEHLLFNTNNHTVFKKKKYSTRKSNAIVEAGAINISKIPTGAYTLVVAVTDTIMNLSAISSKRVFIYNPSVPDTLIENIAGNEMLASEFAAMSEEEIEESYLTAKYIATSNEIDQWGKLKELDSKRTFMFNFWKMRDDIPYTSQNESKKLYYERVKYANDRFSNIQKKGWKTDRGRVYIMYGEPSEIDRYPNQVDTKPYEVWYYHGIEGGVEFVFADITGFSEYVLLHSTMRGELRDDGWQRRIRSN